MNIFKQLLSFLRNLRIKRGKMNAATALLVALVTSSNYVVADSRQQTADSRQQTADSRQQTADSRQQTADSKQNEKSLQWWESSKKVRNLPLGGRVVVMSEAGPFRYVLAPPKQEVPKVAFYGFDYQPVEDDHSWQVGVNYHWQKNGLTSSPYRSSGWLKNNVSSPSRITHRFSSPEAPSSSNNTGQPNSSLPNNNTSSTDKDLGSYLPTFNTINKKVKEVVVRKVNIASRPVFADSPILLPPKPEEKSVRIEVVGAPEILPVEFQMPPVYKEGFAKKYHHYYVANPHGRNSHTTTYENARDITRVNLDKNGDALENDVDKQVAKYIAFTHNGITKNSGDKPRTELVKDQVIERYAHHYGNLITQLDLTEGTYDLLFKGFHTKASPANRDNYGFGFKVTGGKFNTTDAGEIAFPEDYEGHLYTESFYRSSGRAENIIGKGVTVNVVGKFNTTEEHKKYLTGNPKKPKTEIKEPTLNSVYYLSNPTVKKSTHTVEKTTNKNSISYKVKINEFNPNTVSTLIHRGETNIYGDKIAVVNIDNVYSYFDTTFKNEGTITGHNARGSFSTKVKFSEEDKRKEIRVDTPIITEGNEASHHVFGVFTYGDGGEDTIHNTKTGKVLLKAPKSLGIVYNSGNTQDIDRHFINDGEFKLYGEGSSGIVFNYKSKDMSRVQASYANIQLNTPLEILGDNSFGANISVEPAEKQRKQLDVFKEPSTNSGVEDKLTKEHIAHVKIEKLETMEDYKEYFLDKKDGKYYYKATGEEVEGNFDDNTKANIANLNFKDLKGRDVEVKETSRENTKYYFYREGSDEKTKFTVLNRERDKITLSEYVNSLIEEEKIGTQKTGKHIHKGTREYVDKASFKDISEEHIKTLVFKDLEGNIIKPDISTSSDTMYSFRRKEITKHLENSKFNIKVGGLRAKHNATESGNKENGDPNFVENSIGLNFDYQVGPDKTEPLFNKSSGIPPSYGNYQIELGETAKNSVAVRVANANIELTENKNSLIKLSGENNIGLLADGKFSDEVVKYKTDGGTIPIRELHFINSKNNIKENGKNNILFAAINNGKLTVEKTFKVSNKLAGSGTTIAFSDGFDGTEEDKYSSVTFKQGVSGIFTSAEASPFYAQNGGKIVLKPIGENVFSIPTAENNIFQDSDLPIDNEKHFRTTGENTIAFSALKGGQIEANGVHIKVESGAGIAYSGKDSRINLRNALLDYDGAGYALYTEENGQIDVDGSTIILRGKTVGYDLDQKDNILNRNNATFVAMSNSAIAVGVNGKGKIKLSSLSSDLALGNIAMVAGQKDGETFDKYKEVFIDGVDSLEIDGALDKAIVTSSDSTVQNTNPYKLLRRYLVQKGKVVVKQDVTVSAHLNETHLKALDRKSVIGYDMNASLTTKSLDQTSITLESKAKIEASRLGGTDKDNGAIGLFINYGKINTDPDSEINVEMGQTPHHKGIGIYAVNGSVVENNGAINVGGEGAVGIMGLSHRVNEKLEIQRKEFKDLPGSGTITLNNQGKITLTGNNAVGMYVENNRDKTDETVELRNNTKAENSGTIRLSGEHSAGMIASFGVATNKSKIDLTGTASLGMIGEGNAVITNDEGASIVMTGSAEAENEEVSVGMYATNYHGELDKSEEGKQREIKAFFADIVNKGEVSIKERGYGLYGSQNITLGNQAEITIGGKKSVAIFSKGNGKTRTISLAEGAKINLGSDSIAVHIRADDTNSLESKATVDSKATFRLKDDSYGYLIQSPETTLTSENGKVTLNNQSVFIFSEDTSGQITNKTHITMSGNNNIGIHSDGSVVNLADIDAQGESNIGLYARHGTITNGEETAPNSPTIQVGRRSRTGVEYSIGMAAGNTKGGTTGIITNYGTINATNPYAVGMFATGEGSKAINKGTINLNGEGAIGMALSNKAIGENHGTITTLENAEGNGIIGALVTSGAVFKNYGRVIIQTDNGVGVLTENAPDNPASFEEHNGTVEVSSTAEETKEREFDPTQPGGIPLPEVTPPSPSDEISRPEVPTRATEVEYVFNTAPQPTGQTPSESQAVEPTLSMYVDTSGVKVTKPIEGIESLKQRQAINLILGSEATLPVDAKEVVIPEAALAPFNQMIAEVIAKAEVNKKFITNAFGLTWEVSSQVNPNTGMLENVRLVKVPYTRFAEDDNTKVVLEGLENRYATTSLTEKERAIYAKLNALGKDAGSTFSQAVDEMRGEQYANTTRRVKESKQAYDDEFDQLMKWDSKTLETTKVKLFGEQSRFIAQQTGLKDYQQQTHGVFVLDDNFISSQQRQGTFFGIAQEKFNFKDLGSSFEKVISGQFGYFNQHRFGEQKDYYHLLKAGVEASYRKMYRRYQVVDSNFGAKSRYHSYGAFVDNQVSKRIKLGEKSILEAKVGFDFGYLRTSAIREKDGEMRLNVAAQNALTLKPKAAVEWQHYKELDHGRIKFALDLEVAKDFGIQTETTRTAALINANTKAYALARDKANISAKVGGRLALERDNFGAAIRGSYNLTRKQGNLGLELRAKF